MKYYMSLESFFCTLNYPRVVQLGMATYYLVLNSAFVFWVFQHTQKQASQVVLGIKLH